GLKVRALPGSPLPSTTCSRRFEALVASATNLLPLRPIGASSRRPAAAAATRTCGADCVGCGAGQPCGLQEPLERLPHVRMVHGSPRLMAANPRDSFLAQPVTRNAANAAPLASRVRRSISCRPSCRCIVYLLVGGSREIDDFMIVPRSRPG